MIHFDGPGFTDALLERHAIVHMAPDNPFSQYRGELRFPTFGVDRQPEVGVEVTVIHGANLDAQDPYRGLTLHFAESCHASDHLRSRPPATFCALSRSGILSRHPAPG